MRDSNARPLAPESNRNSNDFIVLRADGGQSEGNLALQTLLNKFLLDVASQRTVPAKHMAGLALTVLGLFDHPVIQAAKVVLTAVQADDHEFLVRSSVRLAEQVHAMTAPLMGTSGVATPTSLDPANSADGSAPELTTASAARVGRAK